MRGQKFPLQDATAHYSAKQIVRKPRTLTFRIRGIPVGTPNHKFDVQKISRVFAQSDLAVQYRIFSDLLDFSVVVKDNEDRTEIVRRAGDYEITLAGSVYKVNIFCFGFCMECFKEGHTARQCHKKVLTCRFCKNEGHAIKTCPKLRCNNCGGQGHQRKKCPGLQRELVIYDYEEAFPVIATKTCQGTVPSAQPNLVSSEQPKLVSDFTETTFKQIEITKNHMSKMRFALNLRCA